MSLDWITNPVSDGEPCGPDLDATDDAFYVDYYFDALGRLPDPFYTPGVNTGTGRTPDRVFDAKTVEFRTEYETIDGMLQRSRDIRLLTLRAQWSILAGRLPDMADAVKAIADGLDSFGNDLHPATFSNVGDRRDALSELGMLHSIQMPLMFCGLTGDNEVTVRRMRVADGKYTPGDGEEDLNPGNMRSLLGSNDVAEQVGKSHAALITLADAFNRILRNCKLNETQPFVPDVQETIELLDEMRGMINDARPDLRGAEADLSPVEEATQEDASDDSGDSADSGASAPAGGSTTITVQALPADAIKNHAEARQALLTSEVYFRTFEPSSAALLLVTQARLLIGKSLMEAMQVLLPSEAGKAVVEFGPQAGFVLPVDKLKALSSEAPTGAPTAAPEPDEVGDPPTVTNTAEASVALRAVEDFFRRSEKSSPVPILLQRARSYLDKDFQALMAEMIPADVGGAQ